MRRFDKKIKEADAPESAVYTAFALFSVPRNLMVRLLSEFMALTHRGLLLYLGSYIVYLNWPAGNTLIFFKFAFDLR